MLLLDYWHSPIGSAVVAVTRTRAAAIALAADDAPIESVIGSLAAGPSADWRRLTTALSPLLPAADWFDRIDHVIVVPDGEIALVPFELLPLGDRLVLDRVAVSYSPTAATLLRAAPVDPGLQPPWRVQLRAFADPVFASATLDDVTSLQRGLRSAGSEVRQIASQLTGRATLHVREDDRKAYLLDPKERAPILHLATHAMADAGAMEQSRMVFSAASGRDGGADYLFLKEAYELRLGGVELAVLSACDTERGQMTKVEGVQSFGRAFLAAGARTTVTTLWRVADEPTAEFMTGFYHHLQRGVPRDEALRRAKLRLLGSGTALADPHYWAAFVLTGDALRPARPLAWSTVALIATAAVLSPRSRSARRHASPCVASRGRSRAIKKSCSAARGSPVTPRHDSAIHDHANARADARGCGSQQSPTLAGPTPSPATPNPTVTFSIIQHDIFETSDANGRAACTNCHTSAGRTPAAGLDLSHAAASISSSTCRPRGFRIDARRPRRSRSQLSRAHDRRRVRDRRPADANQRSVSDQRADRDGQAVDRAGRTTQLAPAADALT